MRQIVLCDKYWYRYRATPAFSPHKREKVHDNRGNPFISCECRLRSMGKTKPNNKHSKKNTYIYIYIYIFVSHVADGPYHYHPACGTKHLPFLPGSCFTVFYRDASSALL